MKNRVGVLFAGSYVVVGGLEVGEGGLLFQSNAEIPVGSEVVVNFFVPGRQFVTSRAEVIYTRPNAYGLKFENLPFEGRRMIRDYIADKTAYEEV